MEDVKGFCKLMDISVPVYEHFDYYIEQYSKLEKWKNIKDLIKLYEEAEESHEDLYKFRVDKSIEIINFIKSTRGYVEMCDDNLLREYPITKNFEYSEDKKYLSIDIKKANWVSLKKYDPEFLNELGNSYEDLLKKFDMPEIFNHSKQFRQFIFGNLNPKKQGRIQRNIIENEVINILNKFKLEIACVKNDEVIYSFDSLEEIKEILKIINLNRFRVKLFSTKRIEDFRINTHINVDGCVLYQEISGCNGTKFFLNVKKYILEEPLDIRDLYFRMDGDISIWKVDNLKIELI